MSALARPRAYQLLLANGGRHKAMPCLAEEVLKAPVGQPAFQQLRFRFPRSPPALVFGRGFVSTSTAAACLPVCRARRNRLQVTRALRCPYGDHVEK